jgi:nicotinate dehydrogenase subunit B
MKKNNFWDINFDDLNEQNLSDRSLGIPLKRREFLKLMGGGIVILFAVGDPLSLEAQRRSRPPLPDDPNAFLRIGEDGRVSCFTGKIEMGQGVITSLAQMLADELDVALDSVDMVMGDTDLCPWDMGTFGSMTTRFFGPPLRDAAAEAKALLKELAAEHLKVEKDHLITKDGIVHAKDDEQKKVSYAELVQGKKIARRLKQKAVLETPAEFTVVGQPELRRDAVEKVTGKAKFAGDIHEPGMLYARMLRPPAHGAKLINVDTSGAKGVKGTQVVEDKDLIAVLHEDPEMAELALKEIKSQFKTPETTLDDKTIFDHLLKVAPEGETIAQGGDIPEGKKLSAQTVDATYFDGYKAHAPIENHTAFAKMENDKMTIQASTQTPFPLKDEVAETLGLPPEKVRVIPPFVGGGFGGKTSNQQAIEAARLAKITGKPVQVAWTRAEEFFFDTFRPAAVVKISAGVSESGQITFWDYGVYFAGTRGAEHFYDIPHHQTVAYNSSWRGAPGSHPFGTGAWRAPSNNTNTFARESQIDILAMMAGMDTFEFRMKNLKDKRMRRVLQTAAKQFGWKPAKPPSGRGYGIACGIDAGTYVAHIAEVAVDKKKGEVQVKRVVCAQDMGLSINPQGAKIQMEGCITMGLGYALKEDIRFKGGEIFDLNFDTYEIPKFSWLPKIETVLIEDRNAAPQGGGEPAIICMGGVIANAIFDACSARVLQQPMTPDRVLKAMP